jgi:hypothetical protein
MYYDRGFEAAPNFENKKKTPRATNKEITSRNPVSGT